MTDVSHELGSLRFVVESPLSSKVAMFNNAATKHQEAQHLNPFSQTGRLAKPTFNKDEYGKPLAGSLTEMRGQKANIHVLKEMLELCQIIDSEGYNVKDEPTMKVIPFGELFNIYTYISDKVVGILLRARKHKLIEFEGEVLFQRRDDDVPIFLLKPIHEIRKILEQKQEDIRRSVSPSPQATSVMLDQRKGASPSPKNIKKPNTTSAELVKPVAQKPPMVPRINVQETLPNENIIEPALTEDQAPAQSKAQASRTAQETSTATQQPPEEPKSAKVTPEIPVTEVTAALTESAQTTSTAALAISSTQAPPETIVTPPTPEPSTAAGLGSTTDNQTVDEKTDINNNEEAPAIVETVEASSNTEAEPPADAAVSTAPNNV